MRGHVGFFPASQHALLSHGDSGPGSGSAVTVLLVHGWSCSRRQWKHQLPALSRHYRTIDLDLPGHGDSPAGLLAGPPTVGALADSVVALMKARVPAGPVVIVGHSLGAAVAIEVACRQPERVVHVISLDGLIHLGVYERQNEAAATRLLEPLAGDCEDFGAAALRMLDGFVLAHDRLTRDELATLCSPLDASFGLALYRSILYWDMQKALAATAVPVTVVCAAGTLSRQVRRRYGTRFNVVPVAGVGHFLHLEAPEVVTPLVQGLIDALAQ
ncbi:alpha/beta fold hydrolase [Streptomyces sp. NPDC005808]|uniref:alpha/beta fold hydrolase n=1 Tax=Streptomyces sp. NPDC005808 TaxID=3364734 RepID=UPI0036CBCCE9